MRAPSDLALLALVASDASYFDPDLLWPFSGANPRATLQSYPDNLRQEDEFGFPESLVSRVQTSSDPALRPNFIDNYLAPASHKVGVGAVEFPDWHLFLAPISGPKGFGASIYKLDGAEEYIVALRGTDGTDLEDWQQNLSYATDAWGLSRNTVLDALFTETNGVIPAKGIVHFVGQSLGGGLAQYAAYDFVRRAQDASRNNGVLYDPSRLSLTTFNGFGGVQGLLKMQSDPKHPTEAYTFDSNLLKGVETAHYGIENDIVHRLGGAHLNGAGNTYEIAFRRNSASGQPFDPSDPRGFMGLVESHRIESGFYQGFDLYQTDFLAPSLIKQTNFNYLDVEAVQPIASFFARLMEGNDPKFSDKGAGVRLAFGLVAGSVLGDPFQVARLYSQVIDAAYRGGDIGEAGRFGFGFLNLGLFFANVASNLVPAVAASRLALKFADLIGTSADDKRQIQDGINQMLRPGNPAPVVDPDTQGAIGDAQKGELFRLSALAITARVRPDLVDLVFPGKGNEGMRALGHEIAELQQFDLNTFSDALVGSDPSVSGALEVLVAQARTSYLAQAPGIDGWKKVERFQIAAAIALYEDIESQKGFPISVDSLRVALNELVVQDLGQALANSKRDFTAPYQLARASVFGANKFDFVDYDAIRGALEDARNDPKYAVIRSLIDSGLAAADKAGETLVVHKFAERNPFGVAGFDPDVGMPQTSVVSDNGAASYTAFLPYAAQTGGQHVRMKLEGAGADNLSVIANGQALTVNHAEFDFTIAEGQRALTFALISGASITSDSNLTLSATLTDAAGNATHLTHNELNLTLAAPADSVRADAAFTNTINGDQNPPNFDDALAGTAANDKINAGQGNDTVTAGPGKDWVLGGIGGDVLFGEDGNDLIEGGLGADVIGGGAGDDQLFGVSKDDRAVALDSDVTEPGTEQDWLDGFDGDDVLVGGTGGDVMTGGAGKDVLIGGAGDDSMYGDRQTLFSLQDGVLHAELSDISLEGSDDTLFGGGGSDFIRGDVGNDALFGGAGDDQLFGDADELAVQFHGNDYLDGGAGNDRLEGQGGNDDLIGGDGDDQLFGDSDALALSAHGDDYLEGGAGNDILRGMGGSDILSGGAGNDQLQGETGDDELYGDDGADRARPF
jgi:Ca2+-binding RTX toxin-like protein